MRTLHYVVAVAVDDEDNILDARPESDTALNDPETPVYDEWGSEWRRVLETETDLDTRIFGTITEALVAAFGAPGAAEPEKTCGYKTVQAPHLRCVDPVTRGLWHRYGAHADLCDIHADEALATGEWTED